MRTCIFQVNPSVMVERIIETGAIVITLSEEADKMVGTAISNMFSDKRYWYIMSKIVPIFSDAANAEDEPQ